MNIDILTFIIFIAFLSVIMFLNRKKVHIEKIIHPFLYILMYRTKFGLKFMDSSARKFSRFWKYFGFVAIFFGFLGMLFAIYGLARNIYALWFIPGTAAGIGLVLPGTKIPGLPYLGFWHWIIAIFILALVHEFSHGILARLYNIKIKSSGLAVLGILLPILPAAFVEPDEKKLFKKKKIEQLSVLAAGPFSNLVLAAIIFIVYLFLITPLIGSMYNVEGVVIYSIKENYPMNLSGVNINEKIISINNIPISNINEFKSIMKDILPGKNILLKTNKSEYNIKTVENPQTRKSYLGVSVIPEKYESKFKNIKPLMFSLSWFAMLINWVFILNFLVALVNLLPLPIVDGGRMAYLTILALVKNNKKTASRIFTVIAFISLLLILLNIPRVLDFIKFIIS